MKNFALFLLLILSCTSVPKTTVFQIFQENTVKPKPNKVMDFLFIDKSEDRIVVLSDGKQVPRIEQKNKSIYFYKIPIPKSDITISIDGKSITFTKSELDNFSRIGFSKEKNKYKIYLFNSIYFNPQKTENFTMVSERNVL